MPNTVPPIVLLAHVPHPAILQGLLPASLQTGRAVLLLTDQPDETRACLDERSATRVSVIGCDVFNPLAVIAAIGDAGIEPDAVVSNSDHLQTSTAIVARWFQRPGKDWITCQRAKNKAAARQHAGSIGLPTPWSCLLPHGGELPPEIPYPVVAKPCEGVASLDVRLCTDSSELQAFRIEAAARGTRALLAEAFVEGELFTLETLGDGRSLQAIGGFDVSLSEPPHFVELAARWNGPIGVRHRAAALDQLRRFGIGFGVCHSEFIATASGPVLVEINYRSIGDGREFLLDRLFGGQWFRAILALHRGEKLEGLLPSIAPDSRAQVDYLVAQENGELRHAAASFTEEDPDGAWTEYQALRRPGDRIRLTHSNKDYVGVLRLVAANAASLEEQRQSQRKRIGFVIAPEPHHEDISA